MDDFFCSSSYDDSESDGKQRTIWARLGNSQETGRNVDLGGRKQKDGGVDFGRSVER